MRVLNVVSVLAAREGAGNAERTFQLARALSENGTDCVVLTTDIGNPHERAGQLAGSRLVVVPCLNRRFHIPKPLFRLIRELVAEADVIHLMGYWSLLGVMVQREARRAGVPYVVCPAGALPLFGRSRWLKRLFNAMYGKRLVTQASGWIAITRGELSDFAAYGITEDRVMVIPNGVVESDLGVVNGPDVAPVGNQQVGRTILFLGRLNSIKGPDLLLEAFGRIATHFPEASLVFAGPDEGMEPMLRQRAAALALGDRVSFVGFLGGAAKAEAYRSACLLVVPSRLEAMSIVAVEAGVCGTPVLMTDQCGLDDLREIDPGLVVPPSADGLAGGLTYALDDPDRLAEFGRRWRALVRERFMWRDLGRTFAAQLKRISDQARR